MASIDLADAFSRLNTWREDKTSLEVHVALERGLWIDIGGIVREAKDTKLEIASEAVTLRLELREAVFDWQDDPPPSSNFGACLSQSTATGTSICSQPCE